MAILAYFSLLLALFAALGGAAYALACLWRGQAAHAVWMERGQVLLLVLLAAASAVLFGALVSHDFSLAYVRDHTDSAMAWYYAFSAFWAGQEGSFLFWALAIAAMGAIWTLQPGYREMPGETRTAFWMFLFAVEAMFLLLLTTVSNPFLLLSPAPAQGSGLNPLLQNPGMIFHPPVLFLGYAGFTVPACAALAFGLSGEDYPWLRGVRNPFLLAWVLLTAGIVIGAWWSYMELGWGGYWAWDPVENASLLPWLAATAFLHTSLLNRRFQVLGRSNILLAGLTLFLCFFATFLTRSGVLSSLHTFGDNTAAMPLLSLLLASLALTLLVSGIARPEARKELADMVSRQGFVVLLTWLMLALTLVIGAATLLPALSQLVLESSMGVDAGFYNRVCLPLFGIVFLLLALCPGLGWNRPRLDRFRAFFLPGLFLGLAAVLWLAGLPPRLPLLAIAVIVCAFASVALYLWQNRSLLRRQGTWGTWGVHLGLCLLGLGVAVSGPYQTTAEAILSKGDSFHIQEYTFTFEGMSTERHEGMTASVASIRVADEEVGLGLLQPERRMYQNFRQPFAEASVIPGLGDEIYVTLLGVNQEGIVRVKAQVMPLINWIWIGGGLMCLLGLLGVRKQGNPRPGHAY
ncbi:MAG: cytochrome c biogenesis protein CcsA [Desulfohalobiaceae bacterium]|nr:cytochrome c biogenesis protein CcsA [Desulfohalobiaceae bacterium]MCF8085379.1 cytochrome c biogenesis protein CcsA [Desulfohalobiaceae bacterium]